MSPQKEGVEYNLHSEIGRMHQEFMNIVSDIIMFKSDPAVISFVHLCFYNEYCPIVLRVSHEKFGPQRDKENVKA